jgi:peptidoglycan/xylan/chitin deacetylase (PgdA/CDA1 family)
MKKNILSLLIVTYLLTACAQPTPMPTPTPRPPTRTPIPSATFTATVTLPPTLTPTATQNPDPATWTKEEVRANHELERLAYLAERGPAKSIPALEYHGDNYRIPFGAAVVELSPEGFESQMAWFHENHVHAVTGEELRDWLNGTIDLPARSVILTFDLGNNGINSVPRMLEVFRKYQMFGLFTITHYGMDAGSSVYCPDERCWEVFRMAHESGYVTIGTHTISHRDFSLTDKEAGLAEIAESKRIIEEKMGDDCEVFLLTWPLEAVPSWAKELKTIGIDIAFGGNTYPILQNAAWQNKPEDWFKLPRILPPNSDGISGRPGGKTLEEIMKMYTASWE